jgi:hypothetical protein
VYGWWCCSGGHCRCMLHPLRFLTCRSAATDVHPQFATMLLILVSITGGMVGCIDRV